MINTGHSAYHTTSARGRIEKKEYVVLFSSGPKKLEMLIGRPFADKKEIEGMISQLENELPEISISGDGAILTFK